VGSPIDINLLKWNENIYSDYDNLTLSSDIVGLKVKDGNSKEEMKVSNLTSMITIEIPIRNYDSRYKRQYACIYWDTNQNKWAGDGCTYIGASRKGGQYVGICQCNHLTEFSLSSQFTDLIGRSGFQYLDDIAETFRNGGLFKRSGNSEIILS